MGLIRVLIMSKPCFSIWMIPAWAPQEIPLPKHREPKHPPIYYYIDPITKQPTPRDDAVIRSNYVFDRVGYRLSFADYIHPWPGGELSQPSREQLEDKGWTACYTLGINWHCYPSPRLEVRFHWIPREVDDDGCLNGHGQIVAHTILSIRTFLTGTRLRV